MTFTKLISPEQIITPYMSRAAQVKRAYVAIIKGVVTVTEMQTNSNGLDCQWTAASEAEAAEALTAAGYVAA